MTNPKSKLEDILKEYNGYDFCGEINCNGQAKATELLAQIKTYINDEIIGVDELVRQDEQLHSVVLKRKQLVPRARNSLRYQQRAKLRGVSRR